ncbi:hypothetical protein V3481_014946 [Fusarium oxysporum f. sp. vasinfectum]
MSAQYLYINQFFIPISVSKRLLNLINAFTFRLFMAKHARRFTVWQAMCFFRKAWLATRTQRLDEVGYTMTRESTLVIIAHAMMDQWTWRVSPSSKGHFWDVSFVKCKRRT